MRDRVKEFIEAAAPEYWYSYATELAETADDIFKSSKDKWIGYLDRRINDSGELTRRPYVSRPVLLLYGLSLENIIKGLLVSENPKLLEGGKLDKSLISHDLVKLAKILTSIEFDLSEYNLLQLLSDAVPYFGRYPVPLDAGRLKPEEFITDDVYSASKALFQRLEMQLYRLNYHGMDGPDGVRFPRLLLTHLDKHADFLTEEQPMKWEDVRQDFTKT